MRNWKILFLIAIVIPFGLAGQEYDLLLKNGHLIDPKNKIDGVYDLAVKDGRIAKVAKNIAAPSAKKVIDVSGLLVCPGLIDIHTHVFTGPEAGKFANGVYSVSADDFTFRIGVTTVVDAGTSGWRNFSLFRDQVVNTSQTRILAFLNIAGKGMISKDQMEDITDMNVDSALKVLNENKTIIVGVKIGHYEKKDWLPFDNAMALATRAGTPMLVECHLPEYPLQDQLKKMRKGDIITHSFEKVSERTPVIDDENKLQAYVKSAQQKGVLFDVGHGGAGFWFSQAVPAFRQGLLPNSFGSDLHRFSMNAGMKSMLNIMSKYMAIGMSLNDVMLRATWNPAQSILRDDLGHLSEGSVADIAVLSVWNGRFGFVDAGGNKIFGDKKLEAELTVRAGKIVWDLNGLSAKEYMMK
jgi:dihydroorotase